MTKRARGLGLSVILVVIVGLSFWLVTSIRDKESIEDGFAKNYASCEEQAKAYIDKQESGVTQNLNELETTHRVVARDGEYFPATLDYQPNRINLEINAGIVTKVTCG